MCERGLGGVPDGVQQCGLLVLVGLPGGLDLTGDVAPLGEVPILAVLESAVFGLVDEDCAGARWCLKSDP